MSELQENLLNLRTEKWRGEQVSRFTTNFSDTTQRIAEMLQRGDAEDRVQENYDPHIPGAYFIHGASSIEDALRLKLNWTPDTKVLRRYDIWLHPDLQHQGYGTKINQFTEELAQKLGAEKFVIAAIVNSGWGESLLKQGFQQDPSDPHVVYKQL